MSRGFSAYPAYRESGVDVLGRIPTHWETTRLRRVFTVVNGATPDSGTAEYWGGDIPWVTPEDLGELSNSEILHTRRRITEAGYQSCATTLVPGGSIVLSTRAPIGHLGIASTSLCTNQGCRGLVFRRVPSRYFYYQLMTLRDELESLGRGSTFKELGTQELQSVLLVDPPVEEQRAIAAFLDRETAKIDALVVKKERLIELLLARRAALVARAVTKGLNPNAQMQDSGVEWLGQIPAHWNVEKNRWLFRESDRRSVFGEEELLTVSHLTGVTKRSEKNVTMIEPESHEGYKICESGELVINTMWAWMGALGVAREHGMVSPSYGVYRGSDTRDVSRYYDYLCRTPDHVTELTRYSKGIWRSRLRLYSEEFFEIRTPIPPVAEQAQIVDFLDCEVVSIDGLVVTVRKAIQRLEELRIALVSAAVTGRIDVRDRATA